MKRPLISVIIPNYNHAPYLQERIESVLNQSYDNFEVIILDDKSTDSSLEIIKRYQAHPKVRKVVINEENSGCTFKQWEKGFKLTTGDYIWIAESDDISHKDFLKILIESINGDDRVVLAASKIEVIDEKGNSGIVLGISSSQKLIKMEGSDFIKKRMFLGNHLYNASSMIFKKSVLETLSPDFISLRASGDYLFYIEIAQKGRVIEVPKVLDYFRRHTTNVTPRLYASGEAFENAFVIYRRLQTLGIAKGWRRNVLVGFRLWQIDKSDNFNNIEIKVRLHRLWANEVDLVIMAKLMFFFYRVISKFLNSLLREK